MDRLQNSACTQMQEAARVKVMRAFKSALRYMDEDTLMSKVADHLQLQASPCEIPQAALLSDGSLQAPQIFSCPKKARSRRCRRPASAASWDMSVVPSQGMSSINRPVSAPAERSGAHCASSCILAYAEAAVDVKLVRGQTVVQDAKLPSARSALCLPAAEHHAGLDSAISLSSVAFLQAGIGLKSCLPPRQPCCRQWKLQQQLSQTPTTLYSKALTLLLQRLQHLLAMLWCCHHLPAQTPPNPHSRCPPLRQNPCTMLIMRPRVLQQRQQWQLHQQLPCMFQEMRHAVTSQ